jgi:signal transduction histidine kinase
MFGITGRVIIEFDEAVLKTEASLLKTVLVNIVDNALKASNKKQPVKISGHLLNGDQSLNGDQLPNVDQQGGYRFSVKDYGIGIGEDDIEKLTQAFYMVDKSRSRRSGGSGLGLTLVAEILELFGSALEIESTLGVGTRVSFVLREGVDSISGEIREGGE